MSIRHPAHPDPSYRPQQATFPDATSRISSTVLPPLLPGVPLILVIEDNKINQRLVRDIIRIEGWRSVEAETADDALQILRMLEVRGEIPDAILLDIRLPDRSGLCLARELKQSPSWSKVPLIAVTALAMRNDAQRVLDARCDHYLAKPISVTELIETVQNYVG
jgi:Response regulators consisting of a CheY-like receiver domain and a winged-helix DNA-binding domain